MVRLLGTVDVVDEVGVVHGVAGRGLQVLLCRLACQPGRVVSADALIDAVWMDRLPAGPAAALQTQMFRLRKALDVPGGPKVVTHASGYELDLAGAGGTTDAAELERLIAAADADGAASIDVLDAALALWRGVPYAGFEAVEVLRAEQLRLEELHLHAGERLGDALVESGRLHEAIARLEALVVEQPLRPAACATLMRALALAGRDGDAIRVFDRHRQHLVTELGLEPSPALRRLEARILRGEVGEVRGSDCPGPAGLGTPAIDSMSRKRLTKGTTRLAWAELGSGTPVVVVPAWVSDLEVIAAGRDPRSLLIERLARHHRVITYDRGGTGRTGGAVDDFGLDRAVAELDSIVELVDDPVAIVAISGAGPIAIAYAVRHLARVSHLALFGTYADGPSTFGTVGRPIVDLLRQRPNLATELLAGLYRPGASSAATTALAHALRDSAPPDVAAGYLQAIYDTNVAELVPRVAAPALVIHYRGDRVIPFSGGESLAGALPNVRFVPKDGHWHLPDSRDVASIVDAMRELFAR
jgi:DNA-binding SARP family transcriptional activator/pimeloyl-ACP methyl ester carboxylesterase